MRRNLLIGAILFTLALPEAAWAGPRDLVICIPGGTGSTSGASTYMAPFFRRIESLTGWPTSSVKGTYHPTYAGCLTHLASQSPGLGMMSLGVFLEQRKRYKMKIIGQVDMYAGAGRRLHLVVKKGAYANLAALQGKKLTSNHLEEGAFINKILFKGKVQVATHFKLRMVYRSTKGMRDVARGRADATIINDDELKILKRRSWGRKLQVLQSSPPLPPAPLVAFGRWSKNADVAKIRSAVGRLCTGQGKKMCQGAGIKRLTRASKATYAKIIRLFK